MNKKLSSIPISISLKDNLAAENMPLSGGNNKQRLFYISLLAVGIAVAISFIAKLLVHLISFITNVSFFGKASMEDISPAANAMGLWVILVPVIGGFIVGLMALYGSKAIRGHGIPEAMEQILTNQSKIRPTITYLKPISSAVSIGTGGPFGAEGPIIATGGALGSTVGQLLKISSNERKILLAAGATAGMAAIFGSPIAAIFLAIELLLFEFSPRSIIPVALACITGAAGHHFLFDEHPVFAIDTVIEMASNTALLAYSIMGLVIGLLSIAVTKIVYLIEDGFEKLPVHWMWWPAIGGLAVGIIGYISPKTLGVGYSNITEILSGNLSFQIIASLCLFKFISWAIALGSGTSGGTLAPLLTIGGALGAILGTFILKYFPGSNINLPLAALVGMAAMFAGASRAFLTSIIFALETTGQFNALLPLLATCSASYIVSFFFMENTIMTEKISRRGVKTPDSFEPDLLEKVTVEQVMDKNNWVLNINQTPAETILFLKNKKLNNPYFIVTDEEGAYEGILNTALLFAGENKDQGILKSIISEQHNSISQFSTLRKAIEIMAQENTDVLPVISEDEKTIVGILSYKNIIASYKLDINEQKKFHSSISLKRQGLKLLVRGQKIKKFMRKDKD